MSEKELTGSPSIDKPWLKYYSEEAINTKIPECTFEILSSEDRIKYFSELKCNVQIIIMLTKSQILFAK